MKSSCYFNFMLILYDGEQKEQREKLFAEEYSTRKKVLIISNKFN